MKALSASRIKTLKGCSWKYWCSYELNLPRSGNDGSRRGSVTHDFLECMARNDRVDMVNTMISKQDVFCFKSLEKYIKLRAKKEGVGDEENIEIIKGFILTALNNDFYGKAHISLEEPKDYAELDFDITVDEPERGVKYRMRGFIDRLFIYRDKGLALIRDYKTSKKKFEGDDVDNNLQDLMYSLATKKLFPKASDRVMEFLFLKFRHDVDKLHPDHCTIEMDPICDDELDGLEYELSCHQDQIDNFDEDSAVSNFALDQGFPSDKSFSGRLQCGFAQKKGQLKKDGTLMWHCEYKFPFGFYRVFNEDDKEVACIKDEDFEVEKVTKGHYYRKYKYAGCPKFNNGT